MLKTTNSELEAALGKKGFIALLNSGTIQTFSKGETLLKKPHDNYGMLFILNGSFEALSKEDVGMTLDFMQGDLIYQQALFDFKPSIHAVVARESSQALVINQAACNKLDPEIHLAVLKHVSIAYNSRIADLKKSAQSTALQRASVTDHLIRQMEESGKKYEQSEIIQNLLKKIPRLPIHISQLVEMLLSESVSTRRVTELAKQDPSVVGEVLKEVNSPVYGIRQKVSDLYYAIMLIGFNAVYQILISKGLRKIMPDTDVFRETHKHSILISYIAFELCQLFDKRSASLLSTIGMLHDIGKSTVLLLERENPRFSFFIQLLDPSKIGAMLLERWNIPKEICETIEYQCFPKFAPPAEVPSQFKKNIAVIYLSHAICDTISTAPISPRDYPFIEEYLAVCNGGSRNFDEAVEGVIRNLRTRAQLLPIEVRRLILGDPRG